MAFGSNKSYRQPAAKETPDPAQEQTQTAKPGQKKWTGSKEKSKFTPITRLFPSKNGNSYTVFLKPEHIELLHGLEPNDMLGISQDEEQDRLKLYSMKNDK